MNKHNIWSISAITILFALLLTPLIVASSLYFPYVTGKVFAFRLGVSLALILWTALVLRRPEFLPKKSGILVASGIFVLWLAVSNFLGVDRENSFFSNFERMEGWFTHAYLFAYLVILSSVFKTDGLWNKFLASSVVVANVLCLVAAFSEQERTSAFLGNSTYVAVYALFNLFFALLLGYRLARARVRDAWLKWAGLSYYALSALLFVYVIFRTQTRGTVLAIVCSATVFLVLTVVSHWDKKAVRAGAFSLLAVLVLISGLFWTNRDAAFIQNSPMLARIATISATEGTGQARLMNWGIAVWGIKDRPVLGWGQENYIYVFPQFYDPNMYAQEPWFDRTHNAFLDWTVQGGTVALAIYLSLFALPVYALWKSVSLDKTERNILLSLLGAYAIHNVFVFDNYSSYLMFFTTLGLVVHHQHKSTLVISDKVRQVAAAVTVVFVLVAGYVVILKPYTVARDLIVALTSGNPTEVLDIYEKMLAKDTFGNFELATRLMNDSVAFNKVQDPAFLKRYADLVQRVGEKEIADAPGSLRAVEFYGTYLLQSGNSGRAVELLEKGRALSPDRQNTLYVLAFAYISTKQPDKAVEVLKHAYEVAPQNDKARTYYGASLLLTGDKAGEELVEGYSYRDSFFLSVFTSLKRYDETLKILEQQVADQPKNYQLRVSLAFAYFQNGNRTKAIEVLRGVIAEVPAFKTQGETYIKEIQSGKMPAK